MKIVSISDYAIHHRIGRSEPTGTTYTTRFGNTRQKNVFKEFYQTNIGEFTPEKWLEVTLQIIQTLMENELLEEIKEHVAGHCVWLKNDKEIEEYSASCLASGAYMYWEDFKDKRLPAHKVFIFEGGDFRWQSVWNADRYVIRECSVPVCGSVMEIQKQVLLQTISHIMKYQGKCRLRIL